MNERGVHCNIGFLGFRSIVMDFIIYFSDERMKGGADMRGGGADGKTKNTV